MPDVRVHSNDGGEFAAYLSLPSQSEKVPGIVLMQQVFGVNTEMRGFTDDFAQRGYVAICPDLYWRQQADVQIIPGTPGAFERALSFVSNLDYDKAVADLSATVSHLRAHPACNGRIGTVGYCLGGCLAYLMAIRGNSDCNVGYFGVGIDKRIDEAMHLVRPLMLHIPRKDRHVSSEAQDVVIKRLAGKATLYTYPEADHAFNRVGVDSYDAQVTALADDRTLGFLQEHLQR